MYLPQLMIGRTKLNELSALFTPLLLRKSMKSCRVRNFTPGDCMRLAALATEAVGGEGEAASIGVVEAEGRVEDVDTPAEDGLGETAPVSTVPFPLDSAVV